MFKLIKELTSLKNFDRTDKVFCNSCDTTFVIFLDCIPQRGGCFCPECGEHIPYAWNENGKFDFNNSR